jgi:hypothetical protein
MGGKPTWGRLIPAEARLMRIPTRTVLLISSDPAQVYAAKQVLGHAVIKTVRNAQGIRDACEKHKIDLIVMGHSMALSEKKDIWNTARECCNVPVAELYKNGISLNLRHPFASGSPSQKDLAAKFHGDRAKRVATER